MLNWKDLTQDWDATYARAQRRFPNLREKDKTRLCKDRKGFEAYLAERHQLTVTEAREELEDFLFTEGLNREFDRSLSK